MKIDQFEPAPLPPTGRDSLWEADGFRAVMRNALVEPRAPKVSYMSRAVDDSGNLEVPGRATRVEIPWSAP